MLNKKENAVMGYLYSKCKSSGDCLVSEQEIIVALSHKLKLNEKTLNSTLESLRLDGYIDLIYSDRKGERVIVVSLLSKGASYPREKIQRTRQLRFKITWAVIGAVVSFVLGRILIHVFK